MALIHDEYGSFKGLVTPSDILEAMAGVFKSDAAGSEDYANKRDNGSWLLSGAMPVEVMAETLSIAVPEPRSFSTVARFVLNQLQHIPKTGEHIDTNGWQFEVIDLDGRRVDKILVTRIKPGRGLVAL